MESAPQTKRIRLGDLLVQNSLISNQQLEIALKDQKTSGRKLGRALIELGYVDEDQILRLLSKQLDVPFIDLKHYQFKPEVVRKMPETLARRFRAILLEEENDEYWIGMSDPTDIYAFDDIKKALGKPLRLSVVRESDLLTTLDMVYRRTDEIASLAEELGDEVEEDAFDLMQLTTTDDVAEAPVVKLLQTLFEDAVQVKSSDIHIEPDENVVRIRQRIDGVLQEQIMNEKNITSALVLRLKLMSGLDISEKRLPQDGRFNIKVNDKSIDVRLSTMPVQYGESVVMRLLDQSEGAINLDSVGMPPNILKRMRDIIQRPHGLILVTGPTGSGKTTTLYGALKELNLPEKKIITVEDPVEYRLPRISQVQVNPKIGLTFGSVLRACLRQDPDILLVGEIRDQETAEIALRASITGHLVLSTLHTNDAITSAMRLVDMGVEGYLAAAALRAVLAQRLVRKICEQCKEDYTLNESEINWLAAVVGMNKAKQVNFKHGKGCTRCNNTGYKGRIGIFELLEMDEHMADALRHSDTSAFTRAAKQSENFRPLVYSALDDAAKGITSLAEVMRVAEQVNEIVDEDIHRNVGE